MHTPLCHHAAGAPEEYAEEAIRRNLKGIIFTCHSPMPDNWWPQVRMAPAQLEEYLEMIARARAAYAGRLDIRVGMEMDYFPGYESWVRSLNERCEFHHVLGSVHYFGKAYRERYWKGDLLAFRKQYFTSLAESAETALFDTLAHPDLVKNLEPDEYEFDGICEHVGECLDRIAASGVAMEFNTSGRHKAFPQFNPGPAMLKMMAEREIPVVLGSDSHVPRRVAENFDNAMDELEAAGYGRISHFLDRKRVDVEIADARASLAPSRS
jgi:histidinol-phosphatase (PHP family)